MIMEIFNSDSVELPTSLPIPIFHLHWIVILLALPNPTPLPILSLVCVVLRVHQTIRDLITSSSPFAENGKEVYKDLWRMCTANALLILNLLFGDILGVPVVGIFLSSLVTNFEL